ncbi:hypothetical protein L2E82_12365 [Cichorium intybus]|uniref:Uncharacterized protein n=1 Tax=Cichorium intybus TaxID=13427 RepID=A0ACB9GGL0_CICIN|nr:hypothetical protein L2E82_12365 [Cichorium intybus]
MYDSGQVFLFDCLSLFSDFCCPIIWFEMYDSGQIICSISLILIIDSTIEHSDDFSYSIPCLMFILMLRFFLGFEVPAVVSFKNVRFLQTMLNLCQSQSGVPDKAIESCSLVESILHLEPIEVCKRGAMRTDAQRGASKNASSSGCDAILHVYFLLVGDLEIPKLYHVHRVRDGNSFATRRIDAIQKGTVVFTMIASFQVP